ncbi:hypothetical protein J6590_019879, partial [Homalodisca vitripennis]
ACVKQGKWNPFKDLRWHGIMVWKVMKMDLENYRRLRQTEEVEPTKRPLMAWNYGMEYNPSGSRKLQETATNRGSRTD